MKRVLLLLFALTGAQAHEPTGIRSGFAVHLGTTDGALESELAASGGLLVQGLTLDRTGLAIARKRIEETGRYGLASVDRVPSFASLPYADDLANLVICDIDALGDAAPPREEIRRILAPLGAAYIRASGVWRIHREPVPEDVDEWHHWDHGADGNPFSTDERVAPTNRLRWLAGATSTDGAGSKVGLRLADGGVFYTGINYDAEGRARPVRRNDIFARNAFNGILRWKHPIDGVQGGGDTPPRFALTAKNGRVYAYPKEGGKLHALDAATGKVLATFDGGPTAPAIEGWDKWKDPVSKIHYIIRVFDDKVMQTYRGEVFLSDAATGRLLWKRSVGAQAVIGWAVAAEGRLFAAVSDIPMLKNRASPITPVSRVVALDLKKGENCWTYSELPDRALFRMIHYRGSIVLPTFSMAGAKPNFGKNPLVVRLDADTGKEVWRSAPEKAGTRGHYPIVMARGDEIIVGQQAGFGLDFATGKLTRTYGWGQTQNSCADLKCVPNYTMYGLTFMNHEGEKIERGQTRSICDVGLFPAYGLLFGSPLGCLCSEYINGYSALSPKPLDPPVGDGQRLEKGPAFMKFDVPPPLFFSPDEWPIHMANARRSCAAKSAPEKLEPLWERTLATSEVNGPITEDWKDDEKIVGRLTAPTVAVGKVFVAAPDAHRLHALDTKTGKPAWSFTSGARIDSPPTVLRLGRGFDALCVFGCRDGYVYCLRASDGALVWRFLAARNRRHICVQSQIESAWPVFGSVMTDGNDILVAAGRQSAIDGGIALYKLAPADGAIRWKTTLWTGEDTVPENADNDRAAIRNQRTNDLLVHNGEQPCLWITPLRNAYAANERIDINRGVFAARAMKFSVPSRSELRDIEGARWIWSATSAGLLSRRTTGVGRHDQKGVNYAHLNASKICLAGNRLYALDASVSKSKTFRGGILCAELAADGALPENPLWSERAPPRGIRDAMIVAGDRLFIANYRNEGTTLHVYSTADGELIGEIEMPARIVRDGLAAAGGRLFASCANGMVLSFGHSIP